MRQSKIKKKKEKDLVSSCLNFLGEVDLLGCASEMMKRLCHLSFH